MLKFFEGHPCALPDHLKDRKHNDWPPGLKWIPRSFSAKGPRCGKGNPGYIHWPPKLKEGFGVARWEEDQAHSIIYIPALENRYITSKDVYGKSFTAIEMNPGHRNFQREVFVTLDWQEGMNILGQYSPSALQKFSREGFLRLDPDYLTRWKVLKKRELPVYPETGEDTVLFGRRGHRPDHVDLYYNKSLLGTVGLHWE